MRPLMRGWRGLAALSLAILLVGCGGTSGASTSAVGPSPAASKPAGAGHAAATGVNMVAFTAAGGLTGPITLSANLNMGSADFISYHLASQQRFYVDLTDKSGQDQQQFILDFTSYTGPGTYTVSPTQAGAAADEAVQFELIVPGSSLGTNLWLIDKSAPGTCTVTVTSVTPVAKLTNYPSGSATHPTTGTSEVQGTIACPAVPVYVADGTPPLAVSNGRFDFLMEEQQ